LSELLLFSFLHTTFVKVNEWIDQNENEILALWKKAQRGEKIGKLEPLK
jgi:hypothetical protein